VISETTITLEGDHVKVITKSHKDIEYARDLWRNIVETCQEHDCYKVLGLSYAENPMPVLDGYAHAELFRELGVTGAYRIAWVEHDPVARESTEFVETVLFNRGLPGRSFDSEAEAREWLLSDAD